MADRATRFDGSTQYGFTLLEMLVALGVLAFGAASLIGVLSVGASTRRSAEMQYRAAMLAEQVLHDLEHGAMAEHAVSSLAARGGEAEIDLPAVAADGLPGFPGMKYSASFRVDPEDPKLVLATVRIAWREQGDEVGQEFRRIMVRERPLADRIRSTRNPR